MKATGTSRPQRVESMMRPFETLCPGHGRSASSVAITHLKYPRISDHSAGASPGVPELYSRRRLHGGASRPGGKGWLFPPLDQRGARVPLLPVPRADLLG